MVTATGTIIFPTISTEPCYIQEYHTQLSDTYLHVEALRKQLIYNRMLVNETVTLTVILGERTH
jgi:hypothetical protein